MDELAIRKLLSDGRQNEAFDQIVELFREKVFHLALAITRNHATAADLAQESLLRVWKALNTYNGTASLSTWIYTITRNACYSEIERQKRRAAISLDAPETAPIVERLAATESVSTGAGMDVEQLVGQLPEKLERVVRLFYLEQKSVEETATLLGIPMNSVKVFLFRARKELARLAIDKKSTRFQISQP